MLAPALAPGVCASPPSAAAPGAGADGKPIGAHVVESAWSLSDPASVAIRLDSIRLGFKPL